MADLALHSGTWRSIPRHDLPIVQRGEEDGGRLAERRTTGATGGAIRSVLVGLVITFSPTRLKSDAHPKKVQRMADEHRRAPPVVCHHLRR